KQVAQTVGARLGKTILELGGNNAVIVSKNADIEMAIRATLFGAVGTCGQRCTSTRRLIIHEDIFDQFKNRLVELYKKVTIGNPLDTNTLVGPMIDQDAVDNMQEALNTIKKEGGEIIYGGEPLNNSKALAEGYYVRPAIAVVENDYNIVQEETFAPILYLIKYRTLDEAIALHNRVKQWLSSSLFTLNL